MNAMTLIKIVLCLSSTFLITGTATTITVSQSADSVAFVQGQNATLFWSVTISGSHWFGITISRSQQKSEFGLVDIITVRRNPQQETRYLQGRDVDLDVQGNSTVFNVTFTLGNLTTTDQMYYRIQVFVSDVLSSDAWKSAKQIRDKSLLELLPSLLHLQVQSKASSTVQKYDAGWKKWRSWAASKLDVTILPADPLHVALYVTESAHDAAEKGYGHTSLDSVVFGIAWVHKLCALPSPTDHPIVKGALSGAKRMLAKPVSPKQPLSLALVERVALAYGCDTSLAVIRFLFILLVGYAGFFRIDEMRNLLVQNVVVTDAHMSVYVTQRKNDQYREGHTSLIARSGKVTCPVGITEKLLKALPQASSATAPLVRRIIKSKGSERFHATRGVSYSTIRQEFLKFLAPFVNNVNHFGTHSIKSGAASNAGCHNIDGDLLDRHAGWRCAASKKKYIKYSTDQLLTVSKSLGL